ncbi:efflux RND transporter periplasmic adaptor subunit [Pelodictyon luteolum]|uniref:Secretion protein HlyD n=1 Tax=Chlorobium luteolum (strain DSM 273 / BCRC 81028 / 2530) TaxID=319225 RepID=Q3B3U6_CHLL3|nr:HlyD family efflux transporter periplasmic adaptor subunit [Pelodictyon luteolum]ABB23985.1 Secretion protein HlyD [Pelodictyon luteolum DSM 273]
MILNSMHASGRKHFQLPSKNRLFTILGLIGVAFLLYALFRPAPVSVDTAPVSPGLLQATIEDEGTARVGERYRVAAPITGRLLRITLEEGDSLRRGDIAATVLPPALDALQEREAAFSARAAASALDESLARKKKAAVNAGEAALRALRYRNLYGEGAVSKEAFEGAQNDSAMLQRELQSAAAAAEAARFRLGRARAVIDPSVASRPLHVLSPVDGRVLVIHEKSERTLQAGTPLLDIGDPMSLEIIIDLLSSDAVLVRPGNPVEITGWGGPSILAARVMRVEPAARTTLSALGVEEKRVNVIAVLLSAEPALGDNYRVQARIEVERREHCLKIPRSALFRAGNRWHVFVAEGGRAAEKPVRIGLMGTHEAELLEGIDVGARVILHPSPVLRDGVRVRERT